MNQVFVKILMVIPVMTVHKLQVVQMVVALVQIPQMMVLTMTVMVPVM